MTSYIILGSSDQQATAECEYMADLIRSQTNNIDIRVVIKHQNEWDSTITKVCKIYGFKRKHNPIIYRNDGVEIGDKDKFVEFVEKNFGINVKDIDMSQRNQTINQEISNQHFEQKNRLLKNKQTLLQKIQNKIEYQIEKGIISLPNGFYQSVINQSLIFHVKKDQKLKVTYNPPFYIQQTVQQDQQNNDQFDLSEIARNDCQQQEKEQQIDAQQQIQNQINQQNQNIQNIEGDEDGIDQNQEQQKENSNQEEQEQQEQEQQEQNEKEVSEEKKEEEIIESNLFNAELEVEDTNCNQEVSQKILMNDFIIKQIKNLGGTIYLASHPQPLINGQLILFIPEVKQQQNTQEFNIQPKQDFYLQDYSSVNIKRQNNSCVNFKLLDPQQDTNKSKIQNNLINICDPLSLLEWKAICKVLKKVDGGAFSFIQLLPQNSTNYFQLQNNLINIIPKKYINQAIQISNQVSENSINEDILFEKLIRGADNQIKYKYHSKSKKQQSKSLKVKEFYKQDAFDFVHLIYKFDEPNPYKLRRVFNQMIKCLHKDLRQDMNEAGYTLIISDQFMFLIPLHKYYYQHGNIPLYPLGIAYLGFIHIPLFENLYPETVNPDINQLQKNNFYLNSYELDSLQAKYLVHSSKK